MDHVEKWAKFLAPKAMIPEAEDQGEETGSINYPDIKNEMWWNIKAK